MEIDDLQVILRSKSLQSIVIPKVESQKDIEFVCRMIDSVSSNPSSIKILASIESAKGLCNIKEIARSDERIDGLIFAAEDYAADLGLVRTEGRSEMMYARQKIVTVARANSLQRFVL